MPLFSRKQYKFMEKLFYDSAALMQAVQEMRSNMQAAAEKTADPTAKTAVTNLAAVPEVMGYADPEAWLQVAAQTWACYHIGTGVGKAMCRRYKLRESPEKTCIMNHISEGTYWHWRLEFLNKAGLFAAYKGLKLQK